MNDTPRDPSPSTAPPARPSEGPADPKRLRRRELQAAECAKRGVRFLPSQVLRKLYEAEGLL